MASRYPDFTLTATKVAQRKINSVEGLVKGEPKRTVRLSAKPSPAMGGSKVQKGSREGKILKQKRAKKKKKDKWEQRANKLKWLTKKLMIDLQKMGN